MYAYKRLRDMREDHDLTQEEVAQILQTTQQQVSKWENGAHMMGFDTCVKLARYYNVSLDYLAGLIDEPRPLI